MNDRESILDHEAIEHFVSDVLKQFLPNARYSSAGYFGPAEATRASQISMDLADSNEINVGSQYFYNSKYSFIHYTSIHSLLNILKEKKIRLYNLCGMDDKEEFEIPLNYSNKKLTDYEIKEIKKRIFCFSMCQNELETREDSLPQWRSYAQDGHGVGIVFSFDKSFAKDWVHFMLSKVFYHAKNLDTFFKIENLYNEFKAKYDLTISNFDEMFYKYFAFHKSKIYSSEKEVRLIYCQGFHHYNEPPIKIDFNRNNKKTSYIELELEWSWDEKTKQFILKQGIEPKNIRPIVSLDKIIFGYRLNNSAKWDLADVCNEHLKQFSKKPAIEESSLLPHFKDKSQ